MKTIYACGIILGAMLLAFSSTAVAQEPAHLSKSAAQKLFPKELVGYKLKDVKVKDKSAEWKEYSATYKTSKKGEKELKVVINDVLPDGDPKWKLDIPATEAGVQDFPAKEVKDEDKFTVMVLVGDRFRVDFKSREISPEKLKAMAEAFNFKPTLTLAGK